MLAWASRSGSKGFSGFVRCSEMRQLVVRRFPRPIVRPNWLLSEGQDRPWRSWPSWRVVEEQALDGRRYESRTASVGVPGTARVAVGVTGVEKTTKTGPAAVADAFAGGG